MAVMNKIASVHVLRLQDCACCWVVALPAGQLGASRCEDTERLAACVSVPVSPCVQVSSSDPPELRLLRPLVLEAAGFLGYTQAMNTAGVRQGSPARLPQ